MGLDSVVLLMRFEKEFKKEIPDQEAEKINTIGDMANWFFNNLTIQQPDKQIKNIILNSIKKAFDKVNLQSNIEYEKIISDFILKDNLKETWENLEQELNLKIPKLNPQDLTEKKLKKVKVLGVTILRPKPPILEMKFHRFVECVGALNYEGFVDFDNLTSLFEITIATIGLTQEELGMDIDEIFVDSSFVNDLGLC